MDGADQGIIRIPESYSLWDRLVGYINGTTPAPAPPVDQPRWFPETQHYLSHGFKAFWESYGDKAIATFGYPLSEEFTEGGVTVQYLERARFEHRPGSAQNPWDVLLGRLGAYASNDARKAHPEAFAAAKAP